MQGGAYRGKCSVVFWWWGNWSFWWSQILPWGKLLMSRFFSSLDCPHQNETVHKHIKAKAHAETKVGSYFSHVKRITKKRSKIRRLVKASASPPIVSIFPQYEGIYTDVYVRIIHLLLIRSHGLHLYSLLQTSRIK